jgi:hypothetical protein
VNGPQDVDGTTVLDDDGDLDPREAAALLDRTARHAERELDVRPPLLLAAAAVVLLIVYGALWLSVRHQHPYAGPTGWALAVLYGTVAVWGLVVATVRRRARRGISGRSTRQERLEGLAFAAIWTCVYVFMGALDHAGASHAIVYGIYPATAPILVVGGAAATHSAAHERWGWSAFAIAAVALAAGAAFAGPAAVWAVMGVGLFILVLARPSPRARELRA